MLYLSVCILAFVSSVQALCDEGCAVPIYHYNELGCEPVFEKPEDCCPSHFKCVKWEGRSADKCYLNDHAFEKGDRVDADLTHPNCKASCYCSKHIGEDFTCANIECPELFGHTLEPGSNCYRAYDEKSCCSVKKVCPPFDNIAKCEVNGKTFREGERFTAPGTATLNCICKPNFEGKFVEPFCRPLKCGVEIHASKSISNKCAPVFYGSTGVCPIQWLCSEHISAIQIAKERSGNDNKCTFGNKELNIGDKAIPKPNSEHSPEVTCECRIPPLVTCIQKPEPIHTQDLHIISISENLTNINI